jgi:hypothetical protein
MRPRTVIGSLLAAAVVVASLLFAAPSAAAGEDLDVRLLVTRLTGAAEVPDPGDPDGSGVAAVLLLPDHGKVCWAIRVRNVAPLTAAHIHVGAAGVAGPVVVPLDPPHFGCVDADGGLIRQIIRRPSNYYVNVHNVPFPDGALRGQLG